MLCREQNGSAVGKNLRRRAGCLTRTLYDYYETRDSRWISVGSLEPVFLKRLCLEMDLQEFEGIPLDDVKSQKDLNQNYVRHSNQEFQEWIEIFQKIDACESRFLSL